MHVLTPGMSEAENLPFLSFRASKQAQPKQPDAAATSAAAPAGDAKTAADETSAAPAAGETQLMTSSLRPLKLPTLFCLPFSV